MNLLEIAFWNVLFWALYLPIAVIILLLGVQGHPLGVVLCGFFGTAILSIFLGFQDDLLFESYTPVQVTITEAKPEFKEPQSESKKPKEKREKTEEPQTPEVKDEEVEVKSPEVKPVEVDAEVESDESEEVEFADGEEPEPRLRTDVVVEQLAVDDDDAFSVCD